MATRRWSSKRMRIRSGLFCGSIYWVLLVSGRVSVPKPLSQIQRSTRWLLQALSPRTSFGGFGVSLNEGTANLEGRGRPVAILDDNHNGLFNELDVDTLIIDMDGDGLAEGGLGSIEIVDPMNQPFFI